MPHVSKGPPSCAPCSFERSLSGDSLRLDTQVLGRGCADTKHHIKYLNDGRKHVDAFSTDGLQSETDRAKKRWCRRSKFFDALIDDQERVVFCCTSMSTDTILTRVPEKTSVSGASTGLHSEPGNEGRLSVLFDLQKREIESILVKWLNVEVRDRLESIDRRLLDWQERGLLQLCGTGIRQEPRRSVVSRIRNSEHNFDVQSSIQEDSQHDVWDTGHAVTRFLSGQKNSSASAKKRESHIRKIEATIRRHQSLHGQCAAAVWRFLTDRFSSLAAYLWSFVIPGVVLVSLVVSFWKTVDGYPLHSFFSQCVQVSIEAVFTIELLIRFLVCPDRRTFCRNPCNVIDLLTCLPLGLRLSLAIASASVEGVLALEIVLPVLRLVKLTRRFEKFLLLFNAFMVSLEALPVLLYTLLIIAMSFSGLIYAVEPRDNISNLPQAMWFVMVTMTTLGYGDIFPLTVQGKIITVVLMVVSIVYTAMPIGIVGNAFSEAWDLRDRLLLMHRLRETFLQGGFSEAACRDIVEVFADSNNDLGLDQFQAMLQTMNININVARVIMLFNDLDRDGNGNVDVDELLEGLFPQDYAAFFRSLRVSEEMSEPKLSRAGSRALQSIAE